MFDFELKEQEFSAQLEMAAFCQKEIAPLAASLDNLPCDEVALLAGSNLEKLAAQDLLDLGLDHDRIDMVRHFTLGEELAKASPATFMSARASLFLCGGLLALFGTPAQRQRYIPSLKDAAMIGALAYSEEDAGSSQTAITTTARFEDGAWRLNGHKNFVLNAPIADILIVLAAIDTAPGDGAALFMVEKSAAGLIVAEPIETLGLRGGPTAALTLDHCEASELLGNEPGQGHSQLQRILEMGRVGVAALCTGIGKACMDLSVRHAQTHTAAGKPIGRYQAVGFKLADMFTYNDLGRTLALRAAWAFDADEDDAAHLAACARLFAAEAASRIANLAMQIFAGHGYVRGTQIERLFRDARFGEICEETSEIQRGLIAARELNRPV